MDRDDSILLRIGGLKQYDRITRTIEKYQLWYNSMSEEEKKSDTGVWVKDQIRKCDEIINKNL